MKKFLVIFLTVLTVLFCPLYSFAEENEEEKEVSVYEILPAPEISNIQVKDLNETGYIVTCKVTAFYGLTEVLFPTWTDYNGQDDIVWYTGKIEGDTATVRISASEHNNESGEYNTHIYAYDAKGNQTLEGIGVTVPEAQKKQGLSDLKFSDITNDGYTVSATIADPSNVESVRFPSWSNKNDQDDIIWEEGNISGSTASYRVKISQHNNESGEYTTHVYLTDKTGNTYVVGGSVIVPDTASSITVSDVEITNLTSAGYTAAVKVSGSSISRVACAVWTGVNGQDDIIWKDLQVQNGKASCQIETSDHGNESGLYYTHIYVYTNDGSYIRKTVDVTVPQSGGPILSHCAHVENIGWQNWASLGLMGTTGRGLRVEAFRFQIDNALSGGIEYRAHVQNIGWQDWKANGDIAGTSGLGLRIEAVQVRLTGEMANQYKIQYRVHVENIGWMDWVEDGIEIGTTGMSLRIEAVDIRLVKK